MAAKRRKRETPEQKAARREAEIRELKAWVIKDMAKRINAGYAGLEKAGMEEQSQSYKTVEHYAVTDPNGKGKHYKVDYITGKVRVSGDTRNMTIEEMTAYQEQLNQILQHKTRTVSGVKKVMKKAYKTAQERYQFSGTEEEYQKVWETYKNNVQPDRRQKLDSELVMAVLEYSDIYKMSREDIDAAFKYLNTSEDLDDALESIADIQKAIEIMDFYEPEEAAQAIRNEHLEMFVEMFPNKFGPLKEYM